MFEKRTLDYLSLGSKMSSLIATFSSIFPYKIPQAAWVLPTTKVTAAAVSLGLKAIEEFGHRQDPNDYRGRGKALINLANRLALLGFSILDVVKAFDGATACIEDDPCGITLRSFFLLAWLVTVGIDLLQKDHNDAVLHVLGPFPPAAAANMHQQQIAAQNDFRPIPSGPKLGG